MNKKIRSTSDIVYIPKDNQIVSDLKKFHSNSLLYNVSNYTFEVDKNKIENKKESLLIEENKETNEVNDKSNEVESTLKNDINFENKDKNVISNNDNINNLNLNNLNDEKIVENPNSIKDENEISSNNLIKDDAYITLAPDSKKDQPQKVVYEVQKSSDLVFTSNNIKLAEKSSEIITSVRFKGLLELLDKPLGSNELKKRNEKSKNLNIKQQFELPQMEKPNIHIKSKIDEIYDIIHKSNTGIKGTESNYIKDDKVRFNYKNKLSEEKETTKISNKKSYLKEKIYNDTYLKEANKKDLRYINLSNQLQSVKLKIDNIDFHLDKLYIKGSNSLHKGNRDI